MSADLLGLDDFYSNPPPPQSKPQSTGSLNFANQFTGQPLVPINASVSSTLTNLPEDEDDGWGDFAEATPSPAPPVLMPTAAFPTIPQSTPSKISHTPSRSIRSNTLDILSNNLVSFDSSVTPAQKPTSPAFPVDFDPRPLFRPAVVSNKPSYTSNATSLSWLENVESKSSPQPQTHVTTKVPVAKNNNSDVLFDADDFAGDDLDDEFGDFEGPSTTTAPPTNTMPSFDLLSLDSDPVPSKPMSTFITPAISNSASLLDFTVPATSVKSEITSPSPPVRAQPPGLNLQALYPASSNSSTSPYPQAPRSPSFQQRNPYPRLSLKTPTKSEFTDKPVTTRVTKSPSPVTAWPSGDQSAVDAWPEFEDFPDTTSKPNTTKPPVKVTPKPVSTTSNDKDSGISWDWQSMATATTVPLSTEQSASPPTNIPPPSVIMSILPELFETVNTVIFKPLNGKSPNVKKAVLEDERTVSFLKGYILIVTVAARILAGRKLRWHRDKFLAQSMTISMAGGKGMKLTGIDKSRMTREDREATDVASSWKIHVGRLRSTIAAANSAPCMRESPPLRVPEISATLSVQTAKLMPTAPKACALCGLKREERVTKVDYEVEDSFGEWWVEYWGHRACKNFWEKHEKSLRSK